MNSVNLSGRLIVFAAVCGIAGCGGGGGSAASPPPPPPPVVTTLTGTVMAPTTTLTLLQHKNLLERMLAALIPSANAQSSGLVAVPNANVLVFRIDNSGAPVGSVLAMTTTNSSGNWSLNLPSGVSLGSNLVAQVTAGTTPRAVGQPNQQNCPATTPNINLTPATEYATRALIAGITRNASNLANFTTGEINAIIARVIAIAQDPSLVGGSIEQTVQNILNVADPETRRNIDNAATAGETTPPTGLGGTYNVIAFHAEDQGGSLERSQEIGTVSINIAAKTFSVSTSQPSVRLSETCTANQSSPCARTYARSFPTSQSNSEGGGINLLAGNQIAFQPTGNDNGSGVLGSYSGNGEFIIIPDENGLIVAIKQTTATPPLSGTYQAGELRSELRDTFSVTQGSPFNTGNSSTALSTVSVNGGSLSGTTADSGMFKQVTCNGADAGGNCSNSEVLSASTGNNSFSATIAASSAGVVTVTPPAGNGAPLSGAISSDGNIFVLADGHPNPDGDAGIIIGMKQGSGMSTASLTGTYNFASFEFGLGSNSTSVSTESGTVTLNGSGALSANLQRLETRVNSGCSSGSLCPAQSVSRQSQSETPTGTYSVSATGTVTINGGGSDTISGYASPDGKIVVLTSVYDGSISSQGGNDSNRGLFVLIK